MVRNGKTQLQSGTFKKPSVLIRERETAMDGTRNDRRKDGMIEKKQRRRKKIKGTRQQLTTGVL